MNTLKKSPYLKSYVERQCIISDKSIKDATATQSKSVMSKGFETTFMNAHKYYTTNDYEFWNTSRKNCKAIGR